MYNKNWTIDNKMKLRFLGQDYSPNNVRVETSPSDIIVRFRGQPYQLTRPVELKRQFGIRTYRGILYCKNS